MPDAEPAPTLAAVTINRPFAEVYAAKDGWDAMMAGRSSIVSGWKNKLQVAAAHVLPAGVTAAMHRDMAEPGSGGN